MEPSIVLSHFQIQPLLQARATGTIRATTSPDLGLTTVEVALEPLGVRFPGGHLLTWEAAEAIVGAPNACFVLEDSETRKIQTFSQATNCAYTLMPTQRAPTMLVSGIPMHRIKGTDPWRDTLEKIKTIRPVVGQVLDTATGLGYTAIEAAKTAEHVTTVELDPAALEIARLNPWSRALFDNPKITQHIGDAFDVIEDLPGGAFHRILHDPPVMSLAGHLYSEEFYVELHRVLRRGGRLFHYIGDPESKSGRVTTAGVMRRLEAAGFERVSKRPAAFGVVAYK